jgi:hydroxyacylglutathione hydrolase
MDGGGVTPTRHTIDTPYPVGPVHCYTLDLDDELVLFDTGPPTEAARNYLARAIDLTRLKHVLITHCHIDHYGQAAWLQEQTGAAIYLPHRDSLKIEHHQQRLTWIGALLAELGFDRGFREQIRDAMASGSMLPEFPARYQVAETELPGRFGIETLACPGHSQSDLIYCADGWAITGDTLLRGICQTPLLDVDLASGERFHNYRAYCRSIFTLASLIDKNILPGHREYIDGVVPTISCYIDKTLRRVRSLKPYLGKKTIAELISTLFPDMTHPFHVYIKVSELLFMLDFLKEPELLRDSLQAMDIYEPVARAFGETMDAEPSS